MKQNQNKDNNRKKTGFKIISVILALLLWFYVVNEGSYQVGQNNVAVELIYDNIPEGVQVQGPEQVTVKLWGVFQETGDIKAYVDLEGKESGIYSLPVNLNPVAGVLFTSVEPKTVNVTLAEIQEIIVPVNYNVSAKPPVGYELLDLITEPQRCLIKGNQEQANQVTSVICQVDLSDTKSINSFELPVSARDKDGNPVDGGLEIVPAMVKVIAVVDEVKAYKEIPVTAVSEGEPAEGFRLKEIRLDAAAVKVVGSSLAVEAITEIKTKKIDINGVGRSFTLNVDLEAVEGIKLYPAQVLAEVEIEPITADEDEQ